MKTSALFAVLAVLPAMVVLPARVAAPQEVVLPLDRYEDLRKKAAWAPEPTPTPSPPAPYSVESARLVLEADKTSVRLLLDLSLVLYDAGWQAVSLPVMGKLLSCEMGGLEGRVSAGDGDGWTLNVRGKGRRTVRLESAVPLTRDEQATRPTWVMSVDLPDAAVVTGVLQTPADVTDVEITQGGIKSAGGAGGPAPGRFPFTGTPGATLGARLFGTAAAPERASLPLRFTAVSATLAETGLTRHRVRAWIRADIWQGEMKTMEVSIPGGLDVVQVTGSAVAGWDRVDDRLIVTAASALTRTFDCEAVLSGEPREEFASPVLTVSGSHRTSLVTAVKVEGDGILEVADQGSARLAGEEERRQLPAAFTAAAPVAFFVLDPKQPPRWNVVRPREGEVLTAQIDRIVVDVLIGGSGRAAYQCWAWIRNRGAMTFDVSMPAGFALLSAGRDGTGVIPGIARDSLVLPLDASAEPQALHLAGLLPIALPASQGVIEIPIPSFSAPVTRVEVRVTAPGGRLYEVEAQRSAAGGPVLAPARGAQAGRLNAAQQKLAGALSKRAEEPAYAASFFSLPMGYQVVNASWSALTAAPGALKITVKPTEIKARWF